MLIEFLRLSMRQLIINEYKRLLNRGRLLKPHVSMDEIYRFISFNITKKNKKNLFIALNRNITLHLQ
jgi:hypothetical protein